LPITYNRETREKEKKMTKKIEVMFEIFIGTPRGECHFGFVTAETWMAAIPMVEKMWNNKYKGEFPFNRDDVRLEYVKTWA
jgi:hypothetical protein